MKICYGRARKAENYWTSRRKGGKDWWITFCSEFQPASPFAHILVLFFFFSASTSCNFSMLNSCNNACNNYRRMQLRYVQMQRKGTLQFSYCRVAICMRWYKALHNHAAKSGQAHIWGTHYICHRGNEIKINTTPNIWHGTFYVTEFINGGLFSSQQAVIRCLQHQLVKFLGPIRQKSSRLGNAWSIGVVDTLRQWILFLLFTYQRSN